MSGDTAAVVVTLTFFVVMAAWIPLVECCGRMIKRQPKRERQTERDRVVSVNREKRAKKGRGYETAVLFTIVVSICSLGLLN